MDKRCANCRSGGDEEKSYGFHCDPELSKPDLICSCRDHVLDSSFTVMQTGSNKRRRIMCSDTPEENVLITTDSSEYSDMEVFANIDENDKMTETLSPVKVTQCQQSKSGVPYYNFSSDKIISSNKDLVFYTGFRSKDVFLSLFNFFIPAILHSSLIHHDHPEKSHVRDPNDDRVRLGRRRSMNPQDQFLMTIMRLRLNVTEKMLGDCFNVSQATVSRTVNTWIITMSQMFQLVPLWRSRSLIKNNLPEKFKQYPNLRIIIDTTEIEIEKPSDVEHQKETFSNYKQRNTVKGLVGMSPDGQITFFSSLYNGSVSDKKLSIHCGLLDKLEAGDLIMADRGFRLEEECKAKQINLIVPSYLRGVQQMTSEQVTKTRQIARLRILIENKIGAIKFFKILHNKIPLTLVPIIQHIWIVCNSLANFVCALHKERESGESESVSTHPPSSEKLKTVFIPSKFISEFIKQSAENTANNTETCAYIAGHEEPSGFVVSHMVIPTQTGTDVSVDVQNEEELVEIFENLRLITIGWIHTHPHHSAFLSSIDLHTQYNFQKDTPEAVAIVCSDMEKTNKVFRINGEESMTVLENCTGSGFHHHPDIDEPLFTEANHVIFRDSDLWIVDRRFVNFGVTEFITKIGQ